MKDLFEFELANVAQITPWGNPPNQTLSWFALSDGVFRLNAGNNVLFRYSHTLLSHWNEEAQDAEYQVAAFARDFLSSVASAITPLPNFLQQLTENWSMLRELVDRSQEHDEHYTAFRWLGERSPWTSYLSSSPEVSFIRRGDEILLGWDNRNCIIDETPAWESQFGTYTLSVDDFLKECRSFGDRLLDAMLSRIKMIESGEIKAQIPLNASELLEQHDSWRDEISGYFTIQHTPDVPWEETREAIEVILAEFPLNKIV